MTLTTAQYSEQISLDAPYTPIQVATPSPHQLASLSQDPGTTGIIPVDSIDTRPLHNVNYWNSVSRHTRQVMHTLSDLTEGTIRTKRFKDMTNAERRRYFARMHEQAKHSHIPKWVKHVNHWITTLDNIEDITSSAAALTRLGAFLQPELAGVLMPASGVLSLVSLILDIPKDLLELSGSPLALKAVGEDYSKVIHPGRTLERIFKREAPKTLKDALPTMGEAIEIAQATHTLFGKGISLGPFMGEVSELWFSALHKVGEGASEAKHLLWPHHPRTNAGHTRAPLTADAKKVSISTTSSQPRHISTLNIPSSRHSPITFTKIPVNQTLIIRQPTPIEYYALKAWHYAHTIITQAPKCDDIMLLDTILAHTITMPYAWHYLSSIEWEKLAPAIANTTTVRKLTPPSSATSYLQDNGLDPYEPMQETDTQGVPFPDHDTICRETAAQASYRLASLAHRYRTTNLNTIIHACQSYLASAYYHILTASPIQQTGVKQYFPGSTEYPIWTRTSEVHYSKPTYLTALQRLCECEFKLTQDTTPDDWHRYVSTYNLHYQANHQYPKLRTVRRIAFDTLPSILYRGKVYLSRQKFHQSNPWVPID